MGGLSMADKMHIMKYMQLKYTIMALQQQKFVGKFCFYGTPFLSTLTPFLAIFLNNELHIILKRA